MQEFAHAGFPLEGKHVRKLAYDYAFANEVKGFSDKTRLAGKKWLKGFLNRHPSLNVRKADNLSVDRAEGANEEHVRNWFVQYIRVLRSLNIRSGDQIWNCDETGLVTVPRERNVIAVKGERSYQTVSADRGELSSVLCFVNAIGEVVPPTVIHKGKRLHAEWRNDCPTNVHLACSDSGFINKQIFYVAGQKFVRWLQREERLNLPQILLLDGHSSHTFNYPFMCEMKENNITVFFFPAHCSHVVQPLDSVPYANLKSLWERQMLEYNLDNLGRILRKDNWFRVFLPAFHGAMTISQIQAGFRKTGVYPPNFDAIDKSKFLPSQINDSKTLPLVNYVWFVLEIHLLGFTLSAVTLLKVESKNLSCSIHVL